MVVSGREGEGGPGGGGGAREAEARVREFWHAMAGTPAMQDHPVTERADFQNLCVPLSFHGDGVPISGIGKAWGHSVDVFSWRSMLSSGSTLMTNYIIFLIFKFLKVTSAGRDTYQKFWIVLSWSLRCLWEGRWPTADASGVMYPAGSTDAIRAGSLLAGGYFATLFCIRADLEFIASALGLNNPSGREPCGCCRANSTGIPWTDHRAGSPWRGTIWRNPEWFAAHANRMPLFRVPGVGIQQFHPDLMHCKHLGTDQFFFGSVLKFLTHHLLPGTPDENLEQIWGSIQDAYRQTATSSRFGSIRVTMYSPRGFARLKGKAAEIRHFGRALLAAFEARMDRGDQVHRQIRLGLVYSNEVEDILDEQPDVFRLSDEAADRLQTSINNFLTIQTALGRRFHAMGDLLFHTTIKSHYLVHIGMNSSQLSPRHSWCYSGEDLMQKVKKLIQGAQGGTPPEKMVGKVMEKYAMALGYTISGRIWR